MDAQDENQVDVDAALAVDWSPAIVPADARRRRRRGPWAIALVVVVVGASLGAYAVVQRRRAVEWDERLAPLAAFVEKTRGGRFERVVDVVFNSDEKYEAHFDIDEEEQDEEELARSVAHLRAVGYIAGELDLVETGETLMQEGTTGFYSHEDQKIHIKGEPKTFDRRMQAILVHELTHAYDFQHFDLELDEEDEEEATSGELFAYRAVVEGSAQLVEQEYVLTWPEDEQEKYFSGELDGTVAAASGSQAALDELPPIFVEAQGLPYAAGPRFIEALRAFGPSKKLGKAIDRALRRLPTTEEHVIRPETYIREEEAAAVDPSPLGDGNVETEDADDFGQLSLALLLAPHVGADEAWDAVAGWAGDMTQYYRRGSDGPHCVRVDVAFDGTNDASDFKAAANAWAAALPAASVERDRSTVTLDTCDPGPDGPKVPETSPSVTEAMVVRADLANYWIDSGGDILQVACTRDRVFGRIGTGRFIELNEMLEANPDDTEAQQEFQRAFEASMLSCG